MLPQLRTLFVDDERDHIGHMKRALNANPLAQQLMTYEYEADSYKSAITILENNNFDLSILDCRLNDNSCLDLINLYRHKMGIIVLTSQYNYDNGELELKPKPLIYNKGYTTRGTIDFLEKLQHVVGKEYIFSRYGSTFKGNDHNIVYIEVEVNHTTFFAKNVTGLLLPPVRVRIPLSEVEEELNIDVFVRCHRNFIVNSKYATHYSGKKTKGQLKMLNDNKLLIPYTGNYYDALTSLNIISKR